MLWLIKIFPSNYIYGPAGKAINYDLLSNPDAVVTNPVILFKMALGRDELRYVDILLLWERLPCGLQRVPKERERRNRAEDVVLRIGD
ncbi:hypothetical protein NL676_006471 [Syzygium grande]|nr:hypothetical protein NL676_006471 [Syzygium grande]